MSTAAVPKSKSGSLEYLLPDDNSNTAQYYVYLHFAEVENLQSNESRQFTVSYGREVLGTLSPAYLQTTTTHTHSPYVKGQPFVITRTPNSTHPPIINAIEIYMLKHYLQSDTLQTDGEYSKKKKLAFSTLEELPQFMIFLCVVSVCKYD